MTNLAVEADAFSSGLSEGPAPDSRRGLFASALLPARLPAFTWSRAFRAAGDSTSSRLRRSPSGSASGRLSQLSPGAMPFCFAAGQLPTDRDLIAGGTLGAGHLCMQAQNLSLMWIAGRPSKRPNFAAKMGI
jgi:hypothetical protein